MARESGQTHEIAGINIGYWITAVAVFALLGPLMEIFGY